MDDENRIPIELSADVVRDIDDAVATGLYPSREAAIAQGIEALRADTIVQELGVERVRALWLEGLTSGHGDGEAALARLKAKYQARAATR